MAAARGASAGRRVPGHQSRAVSAGAGAGGAHGNLCVVGDEDQSIYAGAAPISATSSISSATFPAAQIFKLEQNYRSTKTILAAAGAVIRNNRERKTKAAVDRKRGGRAGHLLHRNDRARRGRFYRARDSAADAAREACSPPKSWSSIASTRSRACSKRRSCAAASPTTSSAACAFTSIAKSGICSPICA